MLVRIADRGEDLGEIAAGVGWKRSRLAVLDIRCLSMFVLGVFGLFMTVFGSCLRV